MKTKLTPLILILFVLFIIPEKQVFAQEKEDLKYFKARRQKLMENMNKGMAIISSAAIDKRAAEFYYLTGYKEDGAYAVIDPEADDKFVIYVESSNPDKVKDMTGADKVYEIKEFNYIHNSINKKQERVYLKREDRASRNEIEEKFNKKIKISYVNSITNEMRGIKDELELKYLYKAIDITCDAHINAFKFTEPGKYEYETQNVIETTFTEGGAQGVGFASIVGSGANTAVLHYQENSEKMSDGAMLVMDIGASYNNYTADVTRTIPVNGKFTKEQAEIYSIVLESQKAAIEEMKSGKASYAGQAAASEVIYNGLYELGLMTDVESTWQRSFYMRHGMIHPIGLVVHDVGIRGGKLKPGMILTIEPGLYISKDMLERLDRSAFGVNKKGFSEFKKQVKPLLEKYMEIGVRIEDDILITQDGNIVVSAKAPKEIKDIEAIMK
ncbi:aminopeptidase P N-terminal domain-containing protein [Bacteroidota bacterium]